ncbi:cell division protein FtsL [Psychrobacter sp. P2G3]|uniref:cell division protein FtsL n=1 Tax=Psychrobacter sp. P2G3 TaxID=1699622 RepID=UPI00078D5FDC|nr:cell division protein FtsL [Psychrobacter sp. P2G3]AMN50666.1 cell division protein FtsL [Psychrobacter sp. P2G3]
MAISDKPANRRAAMSNTTDVGELFARRFNVVSIYVVVLLLLAGAIVWSGIKTAEDVQQYHQDYRTLQDMKKQERKLQVEHQRLLIEQQTFSATPQIASRAVAELGMYSPTLKDKLIIQPGVANALVPVVTTDSDEDDSYANGPRASTDLSPDVPVVEAGQ